MLISTNGSRRWSLAALLIALCAGLFPFVSYGEFYVSGNVGGTLSTQLSNLEGVPGTSSSFDESGATLSNVSLRRGLLFGGKLGYYSSELPWLGMEIEAFQSRLRVKPDSFTRSQSGSTTTGTLADTDYHVTTVALNAMVRYPGESWQPYAGIGLGLFTPSSDNTTAPGLNALAGLRYNLTDHFALFVEGKYNRASLDIKDPTNSAGVFNGTYSAFSGVVGVTLYFGGADADKKRKE